MKYKTTTLKLTVTLVLSLFALGCNTPDKKAEESSKNIVEKDIKKDKLIKQETSSDSPISLAKKELLKQKRSSITINNTKFKLVDHKFETGSQIYNLAMNEFGVVKGSFVLVVISESNFDKDRFLKVVKIADDTFRVWPKNGVTLSSAYQKLTEDKNYSTVEVDIDYTPVSKLETH